MIVLLNKRWLTIERHIPPYQIAVILQHLRILHVSLFAASIGAYHHMIAAGLTWQQDFKVNVSYSTEAGSVPIS